MTCGIRRMIGRRAGARPDRYGAKRDRLLNDPKGELGAVWSPVGHLRCIGRILPRMLCGGISALLLQMLHPLALAVWDQFSFSRGYFGPPAPHCASLFLPPLRHYPDAERLIAALGSDRGSPGWDKDGTPYQGERPAPANSGCTSPSAVAVLYGLPPARWLSDGGQSRAGGLFRESAEIARRLGLGIVPSDNRRRWRTTG